MPANFPSPQNPQKFTDELQQERREKKKPQKGRAKKNIKEPQTLVVQARFERTTRPCTGQENTRDPKTGQNGRECDTKSDFGTLSPTFCHFQDHLSELQTHNRICTAPFEHCQTQSSPARRYKFRCVCSYMAGHEDAGVVTGHIGTSTPKFVPPRWGRPLFDPT